MDVRLEIVGAYKEDRIDLLSLDEFMDFDHPAAFRGDLFDLFRIDDEVFPLLHFKALGLGFCRHRSSFIGADHLLTQSRMVATMKEMELNPLIPDCRAQLHGHVRVPEMNRALPHCPSRH